tara:strand:- start:97469 stop:97714 length:246 start_codon:yes stop_codon:yes gene_type:complete
MVATQSLGICQGFFVGYLNIIEVRVQAIHKNMGQTCSKNADNADGLDVRDKNRVHHPEALPYYQFFRRRDVWPIKALQDEA